MCPDETGHRDGFAASSALQCVSLAKQMLLFLSVNKFKSFRLFHFMI